VPGYEFPHVEQLSPPGLSSFIIIQNNWAAWQRGCLQTTRTSNRHFGDVMSTGKLLSLMFIFKLKWKTNIIGQNMQQIYLSCIANSIVLQHLSVTVKIDLKSLES
jgi:hypothetical protein